MTATATTVLSAPRTSVRPLVRAGLLATVLASIATTVVAAVGQEAGISLDISGEAIPLFAFAQLTALFSLVGVGLAAVLARRNRAPRRTFVVTTVARLARCGVLLVDVRLRASARQRASTRGSNQHPSSSSTRSMHLTHAAGILSPRTVCKAPRANATQGPMRTRGGARRRRA